MPALCLSHWYVWKRTAEAEATAAAGNSAGTERQVPGEGKARNCRLKGHSRAAPHWKRKSTLRTCKRQEPLQ